MTLTLAPGPHECACHRLATADYACCQFSKEAHCVCCERGFTTKVVGGKLPCKGCGAVMCDMTPEAA